MVFSLFLSPTTSPLPLSSQVLFSHRTKWLHLFRIWCGEVGPCTWILDNVTKIWRLLIRQSSLECRKKVAKN